MPTITTSVPKNCDRNALLLSSPSNLTLCVSISVVVAPPAPAHKETSWHWSTLLPLQKKSSKVGGRCFALVVNAAVVSSSWTYSTTILPIPSAEVSGGKQVHDSALLFSSSGTKPKPNLPNPTTKTQNQKKNGK